MTDATIPIPDLLDRLAARDERLIGLPTMSGHGLYLVHHEGAYAWFSLDRRGTSVSRYERMDRTRAEAFLSKYQRGDGYAADLLAPWSDDETPTPAAIRAALSGAERIVGRLRDDPSASVRAGTRSWLVHTPWFAWLYCSARDDGSASMFVGSGSRAAGDVMSKLLVDPTHDLATPPPSITKILEDVRARAAPYFAAHGPRPGRILWIDARDGVRRGYTRDARGHYAEVGLRDDADPKPVFYLKVPTAKAHERIFEAFERGKLDGGSLTAPAALAQTLEAAADANRVMAWLADGEVVVTCGERLPDSWIPDSPTTMLETYAGDIRPVAEVLPPFVEGDGWYRIRFEPLVSLSDEARAADSPKPTEVRYEIPKGWAYRFDRERSIEAAMIAMLRAATGHEGDLPRRETRTQSDSDYEPPISVQLGDDTVGVTLTLVPLQSGVGVHGEHISATFHGLPVGVSVRVDGRLDMRAGGHLHVDIQAPDDFAARLKRACLDALP